MAHGIAGVPQMLLTRVAATGRDRAGDLHSHRINFLPFSRTARTVLWVLIVTFSVSLPIPTPADDGALVMGVFPRRNATETVRLFSPLAQHLSEVLGREVRLETAHNFAAFWQGVTEQRYDIVHYNQYHYVRTHQQFGYEVIAKNEEFGESTIAGSLVIRNDRGIKSIRDLKGKKIVFGGGPKAMQSYIVATYLLRQAGLKSGDYSEEFAKSPPNAILAAYFDQAAAAGAGDKVLQLPVVTRKVDTAKLTVLARAPQHAHLPWAVKGGMAATLRQTIQQILVDLQETEKGRQILATAKLTGLRAAADKEYDPHRRIIREVLNESY